MTESDKVKDFQDCLEYTNMVAVGLDIILAALQTIRRDLLDPTTNPATLEKELGCIQNFVGVNAEIAKEIRLFIKDRRS